MNGNAKMIDAVLFDLDGTLTDTEKYYQIAWPEALRQYGWEVPDGLALELRSLGRPFAPVFFRNLYGEDFNYEEVRTYRRKRIRELIAEHGIPLKPGARETLTWLREHGVLTALVTSNEYTRAMSLLEQIGLADYFDRVLCADMVERGKPAPDIYRYACEALELPPDRTFAVEDSPNGIKSAWAAGCKVVMIPDLTEPDEELETMLYARLNELAEIKNLFDIEDSNDEAGLRPL